MSTEIENRVSAHYRKSGLAEVILDGLAAAGANLNALTLEDLAPVDEFHTAGRITTLKALELMPLEAGMHVLDAGCGLGGTARCLAVEHGCRVMGLDLTEEFIEVARLLTQRMQLSAVCEFCQGSATAMPFDDEMFDAAVTFHVAMNIAQRAKLYGELARVLRPDSALCVFDVMKGPGAGMRYPVPWAETEATSFLRSRDETADLLEQAGFTVIAEKNLRQFAIDYFREAFAKAEKSDAPPPLGLHLLTGDNAADKFANYAQALQAHQIEPVIMVATLT